MPLTKDAELLETFIRERSDTAFRTLVERHLPLVFGTARRITRDAALAEEVAQTVFLLLVRKASALSREAVLSGWLYRTTRFVSARAVRSEQRRRRREQTAIDMHLHDTTSDPSHSRVAAELDEAMARLSEEDRRAVLLRYFEGGRASDVAAALGIGEEAAKKRVTRAVEKLRQILSRRGVQVSSAALIAAISADAGLPVPGELSNRILSRLAAGSIGATQSALLTEVLRALKWAQFKMASALLVGLGAIGLLFTLARKEPAREQSGVDDNVEAPSANTEMAALASANGVQPYDLPSRTKRLRVTILDALNSTPIAGAEVKHSLRLGSNIEPLPTDEAGVVQIDLPGDLADAEGNFTQFQLFIRASQYAPRDVMFLSSTGGVFRTVPAEYTVRLKRGGSLRGTVVDESGRPMPGVKVGIRGSNYGGYSYSVDQSGKIVTPPVIRAEDYSSFAISPERTDQLLVTDVNGRFEASNFPSDLNGVIFDFVTPEGAHHKFRTPQGSSHTTEKLPELNISELRAGTARIVLTRGIDVIGKVADAAGNAIKGAEVIEARMLGNLQVLSRTTTDERGEFRLANRKPREILLAASAPGFASVSTTVTIAPGMPAVAITLPPEMPLRGIVQDVAGQPIPDANILLPDSQNDGLALEWKSQTDEEGRFAWPGAPTNELIIRISNAGYAPLLRRLRATGEEHVITLRDGQLDFLRLTGEVKDADSGEPIDYFEIALHTADRGSLPGYLKHTAEGRLGAFEIDLDLREKQIKSHDALMLVLEAPGFETLVTPSFFVLEGNQSLDLKMRTGGTVEGFVLTPEGQPASGCSFAFAQEGDRALASGRGELSRKSTETSDARGAFKLEPPVKPTALVIVHESGWSIEPLKLPTARLHVQLKPWAEVRVTLNETITLQNQDRLALDSLRIDPRHTLQVLYNDDAAEEYTFHRVPAGEFTVSLIRRSTIINGQPTPNSLQTNIVLAPGERATVELGTGGRTITARLKFPRDVDPSTITAFLSRDVPLPEQGYEFYASYRSVLEAGRQQESNDELLAAKRAQRSFAGIISADGVVRFDAVLAGEYFLTFKRFGSFRIPVPVLAAQSQFHVSVSEETADLGTFTLE